MNFTSNEEDDNNTVTVVMQNDEEIRCSQAILQKYSGYFAALLDGSFAESLSRRVELQHLEPESVKLIMRYLHSHEQECTNQKITTNVVVQDALSEALDYLQIDGYTFQAIQILNDPGIIQAECVSQGWISDDGKFLQVPVGKKKRYWRFWVCYLLCLYIMPEDDIRMDQTTFTSKLGSVNSGGGGIELRRELIEYGLIQREGDGSAYWRPVYSVSMLRNWIKGMPRKVV